MCAGSSGATKPGSSVERLPPGCIAGLCVAALFACADFLHYWLYGQRHLSRLVSLDAPARALVPLAGGVHARRSVKAISNALMVWPICKSGLPMH